MLLPLLVAMTMNTVPPYLHGVYRIVCMGASITQMDDPGHGYVATTRQELRKLYPDQNFEVINVGISGNKAPDMLRRWDRDVIQKNPDLVTMHVGINDVWHGFDKDHPNGDGSGGTPLETYIADVRKMAESAEAHHIKLLLISPSILMEDASNPMNQRLETYIEAERKVAQETGAQFVDVHRPLLDRLAHLRTGPDDKNLYLTVDGVHPKAPGAKIMAYHILQAMGVPTQDLIDLEPPH